METELLIIDPDRFKGGRDGPCHSPEQRKRFGMDGWCPLELSYELLFNQARDATERIKEILPDEYIADLENRISEWSDEDQCFVGQCPGILRANKKNREVL